MKHKPSISHDEAMVKELRENPDFAAEYLRAALEDEEEPRVLLLLSPPTLGAILAGALVHLGRVAAS